MTRVFYGSIVVLALFLCSATMGCGDGGPTVTEQDETSADFVAEEEMLAKEADGVESDGP